MSPCGGGLVSQGRVIAGMAQDGVQRLERYGLVPLKPAASGAFFVTMTPTVTYQADGSVFFHCDDGALNGGWIQLNNSIRLAGDFDVRVNYAIGAQWFPSGGPYLGMRVYDPAVPGAPYPNSMTLVRWGSPTGGGQEHIVEWDESTSARIETLITGTPMAITGTLRIQRIGTQVSGYFWHSVNNAWQLMKTITRNTVPWRINLYVGHDTAGQGVTEGTLSHLTVT